MSGVVEECIGTVIAFTLYPVKFLPITELLALLFPYVLHTLGLKKSLIDVLP